MNFTRGPTRVAREKVTTTMSESSLNQSSTGLDANLAAALCYIPIVAIIFLISEKTSTFVKFHALQSLGLLVGSIVLSIGLSIFGMIPVLGWLTLLLSPLLFIGLFILWLVALVKAFQGVRWKMPVIGDIAEKNSQTVGV